MRLKILSVILAMSSVALAITIFNMPNPYKYGGCPEGYHCRKVVTVCEPDVKPTPAPLSKIKKFEI